MRILLLMLLLTQLLWADPAADELVQLANQIFSGQGTAEQVEWEEFTFQIMPEVEPIDIASLFKPGTMVGKDQQEQAKMLFLKSQVVGTLERGGKPMTGFLESKALTMSYNDHRYSPVLMFEKPGEPRRRFEFIRRGEQLKLRRVILLPASES